MKDPGNKVELMPAYQLSCEKIEGRGGEGSACPGDGNMSNPLPVPGSMLISPERNLYPPHGRSLEIPGGGWGWGGGSYEPKF